jgi:hypothetical protein
VVLRRNSVREKVSRENGQSLLLMLLVLPVMLVVSAFVVDAADSFVYRESAQSAADSIAVALAQDIPLPNASFAADNAYYTQKNGVPGLPAGLHACDSANPADTDCYTTPYNNDPSRIFVKVTLQSPSYFGWSEKLFGGSGITDIPTTAGAVGTITSGTPPPISFASLAGSCDNHTLVIRLGGHLTVNNKIYVNSCSGDVDDGNTKHDAFDIFGTGGTLTDPVDILVHGGWETHDGGIVQIAGKNCPLKNANSNTYDDAYATANGCPKVGQPTVADPFAALLPPPLDPNGVPNGACTVPNPCYTTNEFSPPVFLDAGILSTDTSLIADPATQPGMFTWPGTPFYIDVGGERMEVTAKGGAGGGAVPNAQKLTLTRNVLGSVAANHSETSLSVVAMRSVSNTVTLTTSAAHGLKPGDWVRVNLSSPSNKYDGVFQVTDIPDDETNPNPVQFSYVIPGGKQPDAGAGTIVAVRRLNGESTVSLAAAASPAIQVGDPVVVDITSGDPSFAAGLDDGEVVDSVSPDGKSFSYSQPLGADVAGSAVNLATAGRFAGTATMTTAAPHNLINGLFATVADSSDASFSGHVQVTVQNGPAGAQTFTYSNTGPDLPPAKLAQNVTAWQRSGGVTTLTAGGIGGPGGLAAGTYILVHLNGASDTSFNGKFLVTAVNQGGGGVPSTLQYAQLGSPDVAPTNALGGTENTYSALTPIASYSRSGGVATVTLTTAPMPAPAKNKPVAVDIGGTSGFSGTFLITNVSGGGKTFTYADPGPDVGTTTGQAGDGATANVSAGQAVSQTGTVTPDDLAASGIAGFASATGSENGPLTEIFDVNVPGQTASSPSTPSELTVPAGQNLTLSPGTYYGGICIGEPSGTECGPKVGGSCTTSSVAAPSTVVMEPGIYIMAGGGLFVCGNATLDASAGVMIYNTEDLASASGSPPVVPVPGQLDQVKFNTNGNVTLRGQVGGDWNGLTIYQGPDPASTDTTPLSLAPTTKCDNRNPNQTDIYFAHAANGLNGFEGTIYAPGQNALFNDSVSGTATLAVVTSCIFIDGATSTFNFDKQFLFGIGYGLSQ